MKIKSKELFLLFCILIVGSLFRFYNLNWDQNAHLHPDERFLTMVGNGLKLPSSFWDYMNPEKSTFNPANAGFNFFVYGIFPVILNKTIAIVINNDNYNDFTLQGRFLSALADTLVIILIYKSVSLLEKKYNLNYRIKYFSAFFYAISVLPIQLSHFFTVDTFLNLFCFGSFYFALNYWIKKSPHYIVISAISFGLAISSKITAVLIFPLISYFLADIKRTHYKKSLLLFFKKFLIFSIISYFTIKLAYPYIFVSGNIFDLKPNPLFVENIKTLQSLSSTASSFPPIVQWIHKAPIIFPLKNLIIFGIGIPAFIFFVIGLILSLRTKEKFLFLGLGLWMLIFFLYQGTQTATTMRYFIIIYPFIAIFAGIGVYELVRLKNKAIIILAIALVLIWPISFFSIYTKPHTRVAASYWIYQNIPSKSILLSEHWDDALPIGGLNPVNYQILEMPVFNPDTQDKWKMMNQLLAKGDYIILSSNRGWGSIPTVPERYPLMSRFYKDLFEGKLAYKKIKEFTSYLSLSYLGIPLTLPDDWADESFTVYDHPKVMIFKKMK